VIIRKHIVEYEQNRMNEFIINRQRGGCEWYAFLRGDNRDSVLRVDGLNIEGVYVTERRRMAEAVKEFWEDIGEVNKEFMPGETRT
jgi:hypothetical protein